MGKTMAVKHGLGKGLDSLISAKAEENPTKGNIAEDVSRETLIKITQIEPNKGQPRRNFNEDSLQELADSIKQHGVIEPLIVQKKERCMRLLPGREDGGRQGLQG